MKKILADGYVSLAKHQRNNDAIIRRRINNRGKIYNAGDDKIHYKIFYIFIS